MMTKRFFGGSRVIASLILALGTAGTSQAFYNTTSPLGTNTNEVLEYDSSVPFINLFKASLPFDEAAPFLTKGKVKYDRHGWPTYISKGGMAGTRLISKLHEDTIPRGYYTVLYEGQGKLEYGLDAKLVQSQPGRDIILIDPGEDKLYNVKLTIKSTQPGNHLRNISVVPQGGICASNPFQRVNSASQCPKQDFLDFERNHEKIIFNPDYLKFMRDYKVIRFMNMSGVTRNPIQRWSERPVIEDATWGGKEGRRGAPLEVMVELANRLNADPWFNIPHAANDDYIRRFAQYVKQHLRPHLKVYVEYSNETWNGIFTQHAYMKQMGQRMSDARNDAPHIAGWKFYSKRSVEIFRIWEQVFGGKQRLIRTLGGLTGTTQMTETMLKYHNAYKQVDAFAIAPYVFGSYDALRRVRSVQQVFKVMQDRKHGHSLPRVLEAIQKQSAMARKYGVELIAYEGGQHLIDDKTKKDNQHPNELFYKANRHPQMATIYKRLLTGWKQAGGKMFVHFSSPRTYNRFGSKGVKEYITQPDHKAPKQVALKSFIKANPCWWSGCRGSTAAGPGKPKSLSQLADSRRTTKPAEPKAQPAQTRPATQQVARKPPAATSRPATQTQRDDDYFEENLMIPEISATSSRPNPTPARNSRSQTYRNIPQLEPIKAVASRRHEPILVALKRPPQEQYVFGNKAVANYAGNARSPLSQASTYQLRKVVAGRISNARDLAAIWQASWDQRHLYLRVAVQDDFFRRDSQHTWEDDSIEIFLDADASRGQRYDGYNDFHLLYRWRDKKLISGVNSQPLNVGYSTDHVHGNYVLDMSIPWPALRVRPRAGHRIGIDIHVNDDDNGGGREGKLTWFGKIDEAYRNPSVLGELVLR